MLGAGTSNFVQLVSNLAWPCATVLLILILTTQRGRLLIGPILRRLRKINAPGGWGIELSEDAAAEAKTDVEGAIATYGPAIENFHVSAGCGTYCFEAAPIVGKTLAELVHTGRTPDLIAPFELERFYEDRLVSELAAAAVSH